MKIIIKYLVLFLLASSIWAQQSSATFVQPSNMDELVSAMAKLLVGGSEQELANLMSKLKINTDVSNRVELLNVILRYVNQMRNLGGDDVGPPNQYGSFLPGSPLPAFS